MGQGKYACDFGEINVAEFEQALLAYRAIMAETVAAYVEQKYFGAVTLIDKHAPDGKSVGAIVARNPRIWLCACWCATAI